MFKHFSFCKDKPQSILGHNPRLPYINVDDLLKIPLQGGKEALGQGKQGTVFKVHIKTIGLCAWKQFKQEILLEHFGGDEYVNQHTSGENVENMDLAREVGTHPNIVPFYAYTTRLDDKKPKAHQGFLMEFMPGGSLDQYLDFGEKVDLQCEVITIDHVHGWALQVARALAFCHDVHRIIHRDLKPSNILLSEDYKTVKLCDFGIAREIKSNMSIGKGTPQFQAPETYNSSNYDFKADVYSYGCLLYTMTNHKRPFDNEVKQFNENQALFLNYISNDDHRPELSTEPSYRKINEIIKNCWKFKPKGRPTMFDIVCKLDTSS